MSEAESSEIDVVNQQTWSRVADEFAIEGWADPGELGALLFVADAARGQPILDLGVGGGRTSALLRLLSSQYVGVDYTAELVELCRRRNPGIDVRQGDARDLTGVADESQGLVVFSANGIDAVDHDDRQRVLAAVRRVLRPGGRFLFSTLNKDGPLYGARPGSAPDVTWQPGSLLPRDPPVETVAAAVEEDPAWVRAVRNWRRLRRLGVDHDDWGLAPFAAHEYGLVTHFVTVPGALAELHRHGFTVSAVFRCDDRRPLGPGETTDAMYVHIVADRQ